MAVNVRAVNSSNLPYAETPQRRPTGTYQNDALPVTRKRCAILQCFPIFMSYSRSILQFLFLYSRIA